MNSNKEASGEKLAYWSASGGMPGFFHSIFDFQVAKAFSHVGHGGAESGEIFETIKRIKDGDFDSWTRAWAETASRVEKVARSCLKKGHQVSAREAFQRASTYWQAAAFFIPLTDPQMRQYHLTQRDCFREACKLFDPPFEVLEIPYENGKTLPGYFLKPNQSIKQQSTYHGRFLKPNQSKRRPTLLIMGGGDTCGEELYYWGDGAAALSRGYNALIFDFPGQPGALTHDPELFYRPDVEVPIGRVIDYALSRPDVDPDRLAINGHSYGGYAVPRAAAFDHRIKAAIAFSSIPNAQDGWLEALGLEPGKPYSRDLESTLGSNSVVRWLSGGVQWQHGYKGRTLAEWLDYTSLFTVEGLEDRITCPYLNMGGSGEGTGMRARALAFYEKLTCPKADRFITAEEGGEAHCGINNPSLKAQIEFDWLDEVFGLTEQTSRA
jgi:pimeloyl-ACP methyl ester carboxylesterase